MCEQPYKTRRPLSLWLSLWLYTVPITLLCRLAGLDVSLGALRWAAFPASTRQLWFISDYLLLLLCVPLLNRVLRGLPRTAHRGLLAVLAVLAIGAFVSVNLLFKVAIFRVENFDHSTPADTGIYTEDEIVSALNIEKNSNLFSFSTAEKTKELQAQFPYLDKVEVTVQMPATVVVQLTPATERFTCMYSGGWMVLSDALRILRLEVSQPEGLILLNAKLPDNFSPAIGQQVIPETYNSLLAYTESSAESDSTDATPESAQPTVTDIVTQLWQLLQDDGLLDGLTALDISDTSQLSFTYQGRVDVLLGNSSSLDYKLRLAAKILTDPDKGLSGSDRGTLDVSDQLEDGEIRGYFQPYEQPTPTPEPAPEPDPESENAENAEKPPTE